MPSWEVLIGCNYARHNLERAGRKTTPSWNIESILAALSAMIEAAERPVGELVSDSGEATEVELDEFIRVQELVRVPASEKRRRGRPVGIDRYPALDFLVFELGVAAARPSATKCRHLRSIYLWAGPACAPLH